MESFMGQKKTLYACYFLMLVFFLGFNCVHGRTLKVDDKINGGHYDSKTMMALAKHNDMMVDDKAMQFSPPPPPPPSQSGGKDAEDFRPTTPGHSPGIGHSLSHN
ncbi:Precursor of CEP5 [Arabidopsis thaliana]|uniref:Uncharacterized protein n=2 Tax=Arabidopsis TaxID=3701 RepID=A0A8T2D778_9BRAS|nr:hypothetical protein ISN45_At05g063360 [Arabidopsis thaliana x Arabidopsis arenosa]OAO94902.1 hypothetical protein AXX17_AT5G66820 [Arabidopsis thaliana]CAD5336052.1 unnamed protein product [Arabidopsis thaliana]